MDEAAKRLAEERGATLSNLIRMIVAEYLAEHGKKIDAKVRWGGTRKRSKRVYRRKIPGAGTP